MPRGEAAPVTIAVRSLGYIAATVPCITITSRCKTL
jgi:hypothetical protein